MAFTIGSEKTGASIGQVSKSFSKFYTYKMTNKIIVLFPASCFEKQQP